MKKYVGHAFDGGANRASRWWVLELSLCLFLLSHFPNIMLSRWFYVDLINKTKAVIMMMKMTEADKLGLTSFLSGPGHSTRLTRTSMMVARAMMKKTMTMMMKKKIHSRRLLLSTHEWSSNDGDYEHYARPGAMITIMMIEQNNFQPKHWLKHHPFDGFLQILFGGFSVKEEEGVNPIIHQLFCKQIFAKGGGRCPLVYWCTIFFCHLDGEI